MLTPKVDVICVWRETFGVNCHILSCPETLEAIIVDPGAAAECDIQSIVSIVKEQKFVVKSIVNTHGHLDHIVGNRALAALFQAPIFVHQSDAAMLGDAVLNGSALFGCQVISPAPTGFLADGDEIAFGNCRCRVLHTPGHTQGGIALSCGKIVVTGDTLFAGAIGRTDLPGGSLPQILDSIRTKLFALTDDTIVYPGHGPSSTIGMEKRSNPYLR